MNTFKTFADDKIECLEDSECGSICAFFINGHIDKQEFIDTLKREDRIDDNQEIDIDEIDHTYGKLDEENIWQQNDFPKEGYEPVTIYDFY